MKPLIRYALYLMTLLSLNACDSEEIYEVGDVRYTDSSALFGVWEWTDKSINEYNIVHPPVYYLLGRDTSYYVSGKVLSTGEAWYDVGRVDWSLHDGNKVQFSRNWQGLFDNALVIYSINKTNKGFDYNGGRYYAFTLSDPDSVYLALQIFGVGYGGGLMYDMSKPDYAVLSDVTDGNNERNIRLALDSCYQAHQGAENLKDVCDVWDYRKVNMPLFDVLLQHVDTLSSTEIWKALETEAAKWNQ